MTRRPALGLAAWVVAAGAVLAAAPPALARPDPPPADRVKKTVREVFDRPEFRDRADDSGNWLTRQLAAFIAWLASLRATAPVLFWVLLVGCLAALVGIVALVVWQARSAFAGRDAARAKAHREERERLSAAYRDEADRRAAAGDYTEAVRFLFLSLVYRFDERGRVSFHKAYTNREYLDLLGDRVPVRDALRVLVDALDDHWYGQRPCGRPQYEECRAVYDRLAATA